MTLSANDIWMNLFGTLINTTLQMIILDGIEIWWAKTKDQALEALIIFQKIELDYEAEELKEFR